MSSALVITIARQLGSGGSFVGQQVARRMGYAYVDRQILQRAAQELGLEEETLERRRERVQGFWEKLISVLGVGAPEGIYTPPPRWVSDEQLVQIERRLISELAVQGPCVILGHGAFHLLRGRAHLFNVFVHAPRNFRIRRLISIYKAESPDEAARMIERSDQERCRYIQTFAGVNWFDSRNYHLSIDTSVVDFASAEESIVLLAGRMKEGDGWAWVDEPA